jgi:hypothetical protein
MYSSSDSVFPRPLTRLSGLLWGRLNGSRAFNHVPSKSANWLSYPAWEACSKSCVDEEIIWSREKQGRLPEIKELKQLVRDRIAPERPGPLRSPDGNPCPPAGGEVGNTSAVEPYPGIPLKSEVGLASLLR